MGSKRMIVAVHTNYADLAYRFAPIIYQHVNQDNPRRDMLCAINFDGDWNTSNNRANIKNTNSFQLFITLLLKQILIISCCIAFTMQMTLHMRMTLKAALS
jgi:hypothetical protein